jgi:RNA polymerase sigma-70 factor (ECF subfamily)
MQASEHRQQGVILTSLALPAQLLAISPAALDSPGLVESSRARLAGGLRDLGHSTQPEPTHSPHRFCEAVEQMRCIAAGDPAALGRVYDEHHRAVRAFARRLVGDHVAAEDLVHDAFLSLPRAARRFRGQCSTRTFVLSVVVNHARHYLRSGKRRRRATERFAGQPVPEAPDPERQAQRKQLACALLRALDTLSPEHRIAFVLSEVQKLSSHDCARVIGIPAATVRTRVHHARKKLRRLLADAR